jgi:diguanylate cyclase (GGDEF)-like protein
LELAGVRRALTKSQRETKIACREIESLTKANFQLKSKLMRLAQKEAQARTFAYFDELTGLPNRRLLQDRLRQAIAQGARRHKRVVLLLLDLDDFKSINDKLGHAAGDKVLRAVAERLAAGIRGADTACRYGGDEFVIMLPEVEDARMAAAVSEKLRGALSSPYVIDGFEICMTASAGSVVYPYEGESPVELMEKADAALYRAKTTRGQVSITTLPKYGVAEQSRSTRRGVGNAVLGLFTGGPLSANAALPSTGTAAPSRLTGIL